MVTVDSFSLGVQMVQKVYFIAAVDGNQTNYSKLNFPGLTKNCSSGKSSNKMEIFDVNEIVGFFQENSVIVTRSDMKSCHGNFILMN